MGLPWDTRAEHALLGMKDLIKGTELREQAAADARAEPSWPAM